MYIFIQFHSKHNNFRFVATVKKQEVGFDKLTTFCIIIIIIIIEVLNVLKFSLSI